MATFLELVRRVRQESGTAGTGPVTVTGQTGEMKRIVDWVASAWNDIQIAEESWRWMTGEFQFTTTPGSAYYTPVEVGIATRFAGWNLASIRLGLTPPNDEILLGVVSWDRYRNTYLTGPQPLSRPVVVAETPNRSLALGYPPDNTYTVRGEYQKSPQMLMLDGDVPEMPARYHEAIVYLALRRYARFFAASEIYQDADSEYRRVMMLLRNDQLPQIEGPEALA